MFSVGFSELILIMVIAYVIVGPQDLPKIARWLGRVVKKSRLILSEFKKQSGWDELINDTKEMQKDINDTIKENAGTVTKNFRDVHDEFHKSINEAKRNTFMK